ncbi:acyl-CoA dehydrogenase [Listeria aquatica FSL S10-1188]|uniref:Acyl-CoA dehydrogenase n=1 Tax=Listeria aquatica FSL S10-1188 TaxID=1265818 RepID=W7BED2_9LIST|nr:acyl-CoA dehydrogenase [Listeria aquatica FSL S10-1188]
MLDHYLTIREEGQHEIIVQKSRFICTIARAYSEEEAQSFIAKIKKEYWNATHNCSAYLIGDRSEFQKASDDGEPIGTAGIPMLEVLKKEEFAKHRGSCHTLFWWYKTRSWGTNSCLWKCCK